MRAASKEDTALHIDLERIWAVFPGATYVRWRDGILHVHDGCYVWSDSSFSKESEQWAVLSSVVSAWRRERRGNFYERRGEPKRHRR